MRDDSVVLACSFCENTTVVELGGRLDEFAFRDLPLPSGWWEALGYRICPAHHWARVEQKDDGPRITVANPPPPDPSE